MPLMPQRCLRKRILTDALGCSLREPIQTVTREIIVERLNDHILIGFLEIKP
jgi:hypothetical protein